MRALLILAVLFFAFLMTFATTASGVLAWVWIAIMNPHREVFGQLSGLRVNFYVALFVLTMWLFSAERKIPRGNKPFLLLTFFTAWTLVTTYFAFNYDHAAPYLDRYFRIYLMLAAVAAIMTTRDRIHALIWVLVISLGYWGVKGGGFAITTGGAYRVMGPSGSFIRDNNHLALALMLIPPLCLYLYKQSQDIKLKYAAASIGGLTLLSIVASFSRGALLAMAIATGYYLIRTKNKVLAVIPVILVGLAIASFVPDSWVNRMGSIENYSTDSSFQGRLDAWQTSFAIANNRPLIGGGFTSIELDDVFFSHNPTSHLDSAKAAHSLFFQVMGDHGYVGLALYIATLFAGWRCAFQAQSMAKGRQGLKWLEDLAFSIQVSLVGFFAGGALLSMAYYDGMLVLVVVAGQLQYLARPTSGNDKSAESAVTSIEDGRNSS
jgi:probable O-glycosylation ligase (exosortase A-associated)